MGRGVDNYFSTKFTKESLAVQREAYLRLPYRPAADKRRRVFFLDSCLISNLAPLQDSFFCLSRLKVIDVAGHWLCLILFLLRRYCVSVGEYVLASVCRGEQLPVKLPVSLTNCSLSIQAWAINRVSALRPNIPSCIS